MSCCTYMQENDFDWEFCNEDYAEFARKEAENA
jgi:hypothetical protein